MQDSAPAFKVPTYPTSVKTFYVHRRLGFFKKLGLLQFFNLQSDDSFYFSDVFTQRELAKESFNMLNVNENKLLVGQPFHIVSPSPLPFLVGISFFFVAFTLIFGIRVDGAHFGFHWV